MCPPSQQSNCTRARLHYYDFLHEQTGENVPGDALRHIASCQHCQTETSWLGDLLAISDKTTVSGESRRLSAINDLLSLHVGWTGKWVTCRIVKPFLPSLANPILEIRVPTPITVHLDKCQACSHDLSTLIDYRLTHGQLCRLASLMADKPPDNSTKCSMAQAAALSVAKITLDEADAEVLKHLCTCLHCRELTYQHRESVRLALGQAHISREEAVCREPSATDIFDYCVPYGIDPATNQHIQSSKSLAQHLSGCPKCLSKMQQLHTAVYTIIERPDSKIATRFTLEDMAETSVETDSTDMYSGRPINVQVLEGEDSIETGSRETLSNRAVQAPERGASVPNLMRYIKPVVAAAAVVLIVCALFLDTSTVKALEFSQICQALREAKSVCVRSFIPNRAEPTQTAWVSQTLNVRLQIDKNQAVLFDMRSKVRKIKELTDDSVRTSPMTDELLSKIGGYIDGSLGLLPFPEINVLPEGAQWNRVDNQNVKAAVAGTEVYDLTWQQQGRTASLLRKWRVFVDVDTNLPKRTEIYTKPEAQKEFALSKFFTVTYPSDRDIESIISRTFN